MSKPKPTNQRSYQKAVSTRADYLGRRGSHITDMSRPQTSSNIHLNQAEATSNENLQSKEYDSPFKKYRRIFKPIIGWLIGWLKAIIKPFFKLISIAISPIVSKLRLPIRKIKRRLNHAIERLGPRRVKWVKYSLSALVRSEERRV